MAKKASYIVQYRRKRQGKTDYHLRLGLLKSKELRLVVRPSNKHVRVQLVEYTSDGDKIIAQTHSSVLKKYGWTNSTSNLPAAYLTGLLCGVQAAGKKGILDLGLNQSVGSSRIYAAVNGAIDGGLDISCGSAVMPNSARIKGEHASKDGLTEEFEKVRKKIMGSQ